MLGIALSELRHSINEPKYAHSMRGIGDELSIGERIAIYRTRRGMTQSVLAGLVGRSEDWLSKIERGDREIRRVDVLVDLARVLRVTLGDLLGQPVLAEDEQQQDDVPAIREALMAPRRLSRVLFDSAPASAPDVAAVQRLAGFAWMTTSVADLARWSASFLA